MKQLKVGQRVKDSMGNKGRVLSTYYGSIWISFDNGLCGTRSTEQLTRLRPKGEKSVRVTRKQLEDAWNLATRSVVSGYEHSSMSVTFCDLVKELGL